jgi:hypothetical protein
MVLACQNARVDELKANPAHVGISATGHSKLRQRLETTAYGLDLVGWYHSHPRFPARFSSVDMTEQSTLKDPNHLGIVVSGIDDLKPYGVYRGPAAILLAPQAITRRVVPSLTPKPIVVSNDQLAVPNSILQPGVGASFIPSRHGAKSAAPSQSLPVNSGFQKKLSFRQLLLVASALSALAILLWTNYRIYSIENKLSSLADIKAVTAKDDPARPSASPSVDNSKAAENPAPTPANEKSIASLDPPANPKLPVSKSPDKSRTKRAGVGSGNRRNANRSSGTVGGQAVKQGPVRRSAMPKPTPKPISMPTIKTLPKPLPRASVNTND